MRNRLYLILSISVFLFTACATYTAQYKDEKKVSSYPQNKEIAHSFYLIGDAGNSPIGSQTKALKDFATSLNNAATNSTALFLGDNIYPKGFPNKESNNRAFAEHQLNVQTETAKNFKGKTIFIPGNHDWYSGLKGLKRQEKYIEDKLGKNTFLPENGCPIKKVTINDAIVLIVIDSHWFITNWDKYPTINDDCDIKTREQFFEEYEGLIKKARGKTTLIALHHPMFTNGPHGGQFSVAQHMTPLPVVGTLKNVFRKTSGIANVDQINKRYNELKKRIVTLSQENDKVIFVSGHEHSLQYIVQDNLPQIVSGSGANISPTRSTSNTHFSYGNQGYARLDVFTDGGSYVRFYNATDDSVVFQTQVYEGDKKQEALTYDPNFFKKIEASVYTLKESYKGGVYKAFWGNRYREDYGAKVAAPTVNLDTLFGGLTPVRKGGGHQSKSLRLKTKGGQEYVMRALRKNSVQFLQSVAFKDQYIEGQYENTYTEDFLNDVFAGSHPYAPFTIGTLSDAVGVFHTNPTLYYIPKQNALGEFNTDFGDELYMIEERAASGNGHVESFGFSNEIISTSDLFEKLRKNEHHKLDEQAYIRARLFDMLIGDWDRHEDQWRWSKSEEKDQVIYKPIPRDRDQAFSIMGDGIILSALTSIIPRLRLMRSYKNDLKSPKWFNKEPYPLDVALINESNKEIWDAEVAYITSNLTDAVIDNAFKFFPEEVDKERIKEIRQKLQGRRSHLQEISDKYYAHINKYAVVKGTDKDDWFDVERQPNGNTTVTGYRIKKGEKGAVFHKRTYERKYSKEIWIYGLDDKDTFNVFGAGDKLIPLRIIGGQNKDTYTIENGKRVHLYDYKSKENKFTTSNGAKKLTDNYETNLYDYKKLKNSSNQILPLIGSNPDDGFKVGVVNTFLKYGFEQNPFTAQHKIAAYYYFATNGFDIEYTGEFANVLRNWNLEINGKFTSPNYSINFFGFGNNSINLNDIDPDNFNLDYNRVKLSTYEFSPSLIKKGDQGAEIKLGISYESIEAERTQGRFVNDFFTEDIQENRKNFLGAEASYSFENKDNKTFPTLGMEANAEIGYKNNIEDSKGFAYIKPSIGFNYKLIHSGQLVLATKVGSQINFGDDFEFYQAANLGANNGLRGYRNERFSGKSVFYQTTDLRLNLTKFRTKVIPISIGIYGGVDYGRVWVKNDNSNKWNNSYGGGLFVNGAGLLVGNFSVFNADEGVRFNFKLGFGF